MPTIFIASLLVLSAGSVLLASDPDTRTYEMRVYYAAEGKLDALHSRFRDHTVKLFEKHGITNIGYWTPVKNPESKLVYFLAYPSREARDTSWKAFMADPDWQAAYKKSEESGKLVAKVEAVFFKAADYSPEIKADDSGDRVFELRTYIATPGNLPALHDRFRQHTVKLFEKHGMTNVAYWDTLPDQPGSENLFIYVLAHQSEEAAKKSFGAFRSDPDWIAAKQASEDKAGGSLTIAEGGVKSEFMVPTDYSPIR